MAHIEGEVYDDEDTGAGAGTSGAAAAAEVQLRDLFFDDEDDEVERELEAGASYKQRRSATPAATAAGGDGQGAAQGLRVDNQQGRGPSTVHDLRQSRERAPSASHDAVPHASSSASLFRPAPSLQGGDAMQVDEVEEPTHEHASSMRQTRTPRVKLEDGVGPSPSLPSTSRLPPIESLRQPQQQSSASTSASASASRMAPRTRDDRNSKPFWIEVPMLSPEVRRKYLMVSSPLPPLPQPSPLLSSPDHDDRQRTRSDRSQRAARLVALAEQRRRRDRAESRDSRSLSPRRSKRQRRERSRDTSAREHSPDDRPARQLRKSNRRRRDADDDSAFEPLADDSEQSSEDVLLDSSADERDGDRSSDDSYEAGQGRRRRSKGKGKHVPGRKRAANDGASEDEDGDVEQLEDSQTLLKRHCPKCLRCGKAAASIALKGVISKLSRQKAQPPVAEASQARRGTSSRTQAGPINYAEGPVEQTAYQRLSEQRASLEDMGGWIECRTCTGAYHFDCVPVRRKKELLAAYNKGAAMRHRLEHPNTSYKPVDAIPVEVTVTDEDCSDCAEGVNACLVCQEKPTSALGPLPATKPGPSDATASAAQAEGGDAAVGDNTGPASEPAPERGDDVSDPVPEPQAPTRPARDALMLRCQRCSRCVHYEHLSKPSSTASSEDKAANAQQAGWWCDQCAEWGLVDVILAWRPDKTVTDPDRLKRAKTVPLIVDVRRPLPREYLVKFEQRSFRKVEWVPHSWLTEVSRAKLKNFLAGGSKIELEPPDLVDGDEASSFVPINLGRSRGQDEQEPPLAEPDAGERVPREYTTPERIIDAYYWPKDPALRKARVSSLLGRSMKTLKDGKAALDKSALIHALDMDPARSAQLKLNNVAVALVKWQDLPYDQCTWEPIDVENDDSSYNDALSTLLEEHLRSFKVFVPAPDSLPRPRLDARRVRLTVQPDYIKGGQLLPFQLAGVSWLRSGFYARCPGILADEMGLGKTIQVISFVGSLIMDDRRAPHLIVAPNSTVTNWAREFQRWLPGVRVVPIFGEHDSTAIVRDYELYHPDQRRDRSPLRAQVVILSESLARRDGLKLLDRCRYWDVLIVDEGQNLKGGESGVLYRKLDSLEAGHRVLLSGTPLNNNLVELFNLLNWLQPNDRWADVKALQKRYENLDAQLVTELQDMLRPHFLRRTKEEVLQLPPKTEFIVPVSLRPIQKRLYKSILESNIEDIQSFSEGSSSKSGAKVRSTMSNVLMNLRKCIQHPYLVNPDLRDVELQNEQHLATAQQRLVDASGKFQLLQRLLRRLKERGHRVLLFSQFVIALDIVEPFLRNEGYRLLRLDGKTGTKHRQKAIDAFNAPDSPYFIFLLSTRAGGVGINLTSADTVIIMDPDFNPHMDMQAIARAHRIGQKRNTLVFTLVCKNTAEERIIEAAKRKRLLEHVIVENMGNDELAPLDLESMLKHGAQALFVEGGLEENEKDIKVRNGGYEIGAERSQTDRIFHLQFTDADIDKLIDDGEQAEREVTQQPRSSSNFSFAQVWDHSSAADTGLQQTQAELDAEKDFWADVLRQQQEAALKKRQLAEASGSGRGVRRKATKINYATANGAKNRHDGDEGDDAYMDGSEASSRSDTEDEDAIPSQAAGAQVQAAPQAQPANGATASDAIADAAVPVTQPDQEQPRASAPPLDQQETLGGQNGAMPNTVRVVPTQASQRAQSRALHEPSPREYPAVVALLQSLKTNWHSSSGVRDATMVHRMIGVARLYAMRAHLGQQTPSTARTLRYVADVLQRRRKERHAATSAQRDDQTQSTSRSSAVGDYHTVNGSAQGSAPAVNSTNAGASPAPTSEPARGPPKSFLSLLQESQARLYERDKAQERQRHAQEQDERSSKTALAVKDKRPAGTTSNMSSPSPLSSATASPVLSKQADQRPAMSSNPTGRTSTSLESAVPRGASTGPSVAPIAQGQGQGAGGASQQTAPFGNPLQQQGPRPSNLPSVPPTGQSQAQLHSPNGHGDPLARGTRQSGPAEPPEVIYVGQGPRHSAAQAVQQTSSSTTTPTPSNQGRATNEEIPVRNATSNGLAPPEKRRRANPLIPSDILATANRASTSASTSSPTVSRPPRTQGAGSIVSNHVGASVVNTTVNTDRRGTVTMATLGRWLMIRSELPHSTTAQLEEHSKQRGAPPPRLVAHRPYLSYNQARYFAALLHLPLSVMAEAFYLIDRDKLPEQYQQLPHDGVSLLDALAIKDRVMNVLFSILYTLSVIESGNSISETIHGRPAPVELGPYQGQGGGIGPSQVSHQGMDASLPSYAAGAVTLAPTGLPTAAGVDTAQFTSGGQGIHAGPGPGPYYNVVGPGFARHPPMAAMPVQPQAMMTVAPGSCVPAAAGQDATLELTRSGQQPAQATQQPLTGGAFQPMPQQSQAQIQAQGRPPALNASAMLPWAQQGRQQQVSTTLTGGVPTPTQSPRVADFPPGATATLTSSTSAPGALYTDQPHSQAPVPATAHARMLAPLRAASAGFPVGAVAFGSPSLGVEGQGTHHAAQGQITDQVQSQVPGPDQGAGPAPSPSQGPALPAFRGLPN